MSRTARLLFTLAAGLLVSCGALCTLTQSQTCPPPSVLYQIRAEGKILDESNRPRPNVAIFSPSPSVLPSVNTLSKADGSYSIFQEICSTSKPLCPIILPGMETYFYQAGWTFTPGFFYRCASSTLSVTARRSVFSAVSAASYQPGIVPGAISSLFPQTNNVVLATSTQSANQIPLPTTLANTTLTISPLTQNHPTPVQLIFVSPTQVNFYLPNAILQNTQVVSLSLKNGNGITYTADALIQRLGPACFTANATGQGPASGVVARVRNGALSYEDLVHFDPTLNRWVNIPVDLGPATDQVFLALFGTGFRAHTGLNFVTASVGGVTAPVTYAGAQPSFIGVDQTNILLPRTLSGRGEVDVALTVEGHTTNLVKVAIK